MLMLILYNGNRRWSFQNLQWLSGNNMSLCRSDVRTILELCLNGTKTLSERCQNGVRTVSERCQNGIISCPKKSIYSDKLPTF